MFVDLRLEGFEVGCERVLRENELSEVEWERECMI